MWKNLRQLNSHIEQEQSAAHELPDLGQLQAQQQVATSEEEVTSKSTFPQHIDAVNSACSLTTSWPQDSMLRTPRAWASLPVLKAVRTPTSS